MSSTARVELETRAELENRDYFARLYGWVAPAEIVCDRCDGIGEIEIACKACGGDGGRSCRCWDCGEYHWRPCEQCQEMGGEIAQCPQCKGRRFCDPEAATEPCAETLPLPFGAGAPRPRPSGRRIRRRGGA